MDAQNTYREKGSITALNRVFVERWLNEKAKRGELLVEAGNGGFEFTRGAPGQYIYRVFKRSQDLLSALLDAPQGEAGQTALAGQLGGWVVVRFAAKSGERYPNEQDGSLIRFNAFLQWFCAAFLALLLAWSVWVYAGQLRQRQTLIALGMAELAGIASSGGVWFVVLAAALCCAFAALVLPALLRLLKERRKPLPEDGDNETKERMQINGEKDNI